MKVQTKEELQQNIQRMVRNRHKKQHQKMIVYNNWWTRQIHGNYMSNQQFENVKEKLQ